MSPGYVALGTRLLSRPGTQQPTGTGHRWTESVPPPGTDATLLAVVPIPGAGTSLAIVGYMISTSGQAESGPATLEPDPDATTGLFIDHAQRQVRADGEPIPLTFREFELLAFLSAHPATVFSRADLVEQVWRRGPARDRAGRAARARSVAAGSRTVDVHVSRLRRKLGPVYGPCLVTEHRTGYQFRLLA